ncbi:hypothetical protein FQN57_006534 [Myotisia sp. PD_48]|nr:hypothetical protein FQN57_006534 [Myotisia sp. PD_48]
MNWPTACNHSLKFVPMIERQFPEYMQEIKGIAQGSGTSVEDILALNVRTEIAYGMFSDGCTAFSWASEGEYFLAQNWDWEPEQAPNLISLHINQSQHGKPNIHMITEAGIIGKIGLNSNGVGVTLNAIKAAGVDFNKLPCHLALRTVLESSSRAGAIAKLENIGVSSSCHILVADETGATGLECSSRDIIKLNVADSVESRKDVITHSNHFVHQHDGIDSVEYLPDSKPRLERVRELLAQSGPKPTAEIIEGILKDESGYPGSICRDAIEQYASASLFGIIMNLRQKKAKVLIGRPVNPTETIELAH